MGTAAGGGFPQWNCWCRCCQAARSDPEAARPRTQSSVAISHDSQHWFLLNASPDVRDQLIRLPFNGRPFGIRHVPIEAVVLTDAEIDHSLGIMLLREAQHLPLYSTTAVRSILEEDSRFLPVTRAFADVPWTELPLDASIELRHRDGAASGLSVEAFEVPADPPRFASHSKSGHTVGLTVRESPSGRVCMFVPGCGDLSPALRERFAKADVLLFDGTFWTDDEPATVGIGARTARQMDHIPIAGEGGSLEQLTILPCRYRVYTHINNTNPILLEHSPERAAVAAAGVTVGHDGLYIVI
jgi:pyrroloquinoline quinone biosynthesis protein B